MKEAVWDYRNPYKWMEKTAAGGFAPLMIDCAVTGGLMGKEYNPNVPETVEEQAEAVYAAYQEGAVIAHIQAGSPIEPADKDAYSKINGEIRKRCPDIIISNAAGMRMDSPIEEKLSCIYGDCKPDMVSLYTGIFQLNVTLKERTAPLPNPRPEQTLDLNLPTSYSQVRECAKVLREQGLKPELKILQPGEYWVMNDLLGKGLLDDPFIVELAFGLRSFNYAHPQRFVEMIRELPAKSIFFAAGAGSWQLPMNLMSMLYGGHVKVGFEDSLEYNPGVPAQSPAQMTARIRRIAEEMNRPLATAAEAREMLGL